MLNLTSKEYPVHTRRPNNDVCTKSKQRRVYEVQTTSCVYREVTWSITKRNSYGNELHTMINYSTPLLCQSAGRSKYKKHNVYDETPNLLTEAATRVVL